MKRNMKIFSAALALVLVFGAVVGGTLAWLMDQTESITNVFTVGNVDIELAETEPILGIDDQGRYRFKMVPGDTLSKDPKITVEANSENCYLYVKVVESEDFDTYITYGMADGWTSLEGVENVYYREVSTSDADQEFEVIGYDANSDTSITGEELNKVFVNESLLQTQMDAIANGGAEMPTLTFTAYAIQKANTGADAKAAWTTANFD